MVTFIMQVSKNGKAFATVGVNGKTTMIMRNKTAHTIYNRFLELGAKPTIFGDKKKTYLITMEK